MPDPGKYKEAWDEFRLAKMSSMGDIFDELYIMKADPNNLIGYSSVVDLMLEEKSRKSVMYYLQQIDPPRWFLCHICFREPWSSGCRLCENYDSFIPSGGALLGTGDSL